MSAPTSAQIEALLNFLEEHRDLARGNLRSVEGRVTSHRLWDEICITLNAMGGSNKTTKQWQKVWTDKKYLAKKAAAAARRSASTTGGGPSTAPQLAEWELRIISIMGDGFGEPQTTARVPAFPENNHEPSMPRPDSMSLESHHEEQLTAVSEVNEGVQHTDLQLHVQPQPTQADQVLHNTMQNRRRLRRQSGLRADASVRERLFRTDCSDCSEEQRVNCDRQRNEELAGIRRTLLELLVCMRQISEQLLAKNK